MSSPLRLEDDQREPLSRLPDPRFSALPVPGDHDSRESGWGAEGLGPTRLADAWAPLALNQA